MTWQTKITILALFLSTLAIKANCTGVRDLPNGSGAPNSISLDDHWHLWLDQKADWKNDKLFLPDEVDLTKLPVNPPTGGWRTLDGAGVPVSLPATVEQYYWDHGLRSPDTSQKAAERALQSEPYMGVSWWYRTFSVPHLAPGERLEFSFPGARQRAEVYVNGVLVGYNAVAEIPFTADATGALKPGLNLLAIRITNPGGTFRWGDYNLQTWGQYKFPISHGFGGVDGGVAMAVRGPVFVEDLYAANHPMPYAVTLHAHIESNGPAYRGKVAFSIARNNEVAWKGEATVDVPAGASTDVAIDANVPNAKLWDVGRPNLYRASAVISRVEHSGRVTDFGFRWFNAEGIGKNPRLMLNGRRIFVRSAISWGYWAPNGMFPDGSAVEREVAAVRALGLNAIQSHRHFPKAAALVGFDHAGLLRYCEPGGGSALWDETERQPQHPGPIDPSGAGGEPSSFANRYEMAKLLAMIKAYRSHPSVIMWSLNNETASASNNPKMFFAMRMAQKLDPSRIIVLKSGFDPEGEIMARPYVDALEYGEASTHHDSGWHDIHNEENAGIYQDSLYRDPRDFKTYSADSTGIAMWGELGTGDSPDNDAEAAQWYRDHKVSGYNRVWVEKRLAAYRTFLHKYKFGSAFPTPADLFRAVGERHYFAASKVVENARIADANDYIALTGWESTTIDNNSGLVDALRDLKGNPGRMRQANAAELLVIRPRHYVIEKGAEATVDAFEVNEVRRRGAFTFHFSAAMDKSKEKPFFETSFPVTIQGGEVFAQLLKENLRFAVPEAGPVTLRATLSARNGTAPLLERTEPMLAVDPYPTPIAGTIAAADYDGSLIPALHRELGVNAVPLASAPHVDTIVVSSAGVPRLTWPRQQETLTSVQNTDDPGLYARQFVGKQGAVARYEGFAQGRLKVDLYFAEPRFNHPGQRVFDVALNGNAVLHKFDLVAEAGGQGRAVVRTFQIESPDGHLDLSIPNVENGQPLIAAIRITDTKGRTVREVFRNGSYRDRAGADWSSAVNSLTAFDWQSLLPTVLDRVKQGSRLVLLGTDAADIGHAAQVLDHLGVLTYSGMAGLDATPWIGHWYFSRKHWLLEGLPAGGVLDWQFQAAAPGDGILVDAPGMEPVIAYGKNPMPALGFGAVVVPYGKGEIVLLGIGGLNPAFLQGDPSGFQPLAAQRIVYNALQHGRHAE